MLRRDPIAALIALSALCALAPAAAQESPRSALAINDADIIEAAMSVTRTIELAAVSMAEVLGATGAPVAARTASASASGAAVALGSWNGAVGMSEFPAPPIIPRTVDDAWEFRVEQSQRRNTFFDVDYQLRAANGSPGMLSHTGDETSTMLVRLQPVTPPVVDSDGTHDVFQGGLVFYLDLAGARRSGRYQGTLTVTFNNY
ncbi:MAG: hypothetical protein GKS06_15670 [Acidobacteria bacterium]|nr:hypothetical protein [Acidobacteriota bacterium]